jgi:tetratricopeptide (TPR) repeat protein
MAVRPVHLRQNPLLALAFLPLFLLHFAFGQATLAAQPSHSDNVQTHLGKGYDALKQDRYEVAVEEFRAALALDPSLVLRAQFPLAVALFEQHKSAEARKEFEAVRRETGDHPNVLYYLGRLDIETRDFAGAVKNLSQAMAKPPFPDTAYYLGFAYFKQNDLPNAEKWLKEAAQLNPRDSRIPYQLGFVYRKQGREEEAKKSLALSEDLHRQDDTEAQLRSECGEKLDKGPRDEAHAICQKLYHNDDAERLTALGMIYGQHGDLEAALKPFLRAAELSPQSPQVQYNLALTYFQLNRFEDARTPLTQALKRWPDLFPLNALYGAVLVKLGEQEQAVEVLRHAHELNPQDSSTGDLLYATTLKLAEKNQVAQQHSDALRYYEEAAKLRPDTPEPHRGMAETYAQMGKSAQAATERQEADRLGNK